MRDELISGLKKVSFHYRRSSTGFLGDYFSYPGERVSIEKKKKKKLLSLLNTNNY